VSPIPTSDLPGYKNLHERVISALDYCKETRTIDFKESATWDDLKWKIIKTSMAMANLRDGGILIIGVSERGESWDLTGIKKEHLDTYDVDIVIDFINSYASPPVDIDIFTLKYSNGNIFLIISIKEFISTPVVCKKNGPDNENIKEGEFYIRPLRLARSAKITNSNDMHDLLELASEKKAREFIEKAKRVGYEIPEKNNEAYDNELGEI